MRDRLKKAPMGKSVWDGLPRRSVDSVGGLKTTGNYSGLHNVKSATDPTPLTRVTGDEAQSHDRETKRRLLNEGEDFSGHLEELPQVNWSLWVGTHFQHGLSLYADIPTSHRDNLIKIHHYSPAGAIKSNLMKRGDFFGGLLPEPPLRESVDRLVSGCRLHLPA